MTTTEWNVPLHIPHELIYDYDRYTTPALYEVPQFSLARKLASEAPPIFWTPRHGGHWVVVPAAMGAEILRRTDLYSTDPTYCPWKRTLPRLLPTGYDPPELLEARRIVAPLFTPKAIGELEAHIRATVVEIIEEIHPRKQCEFVADVGKRFPISIFLLMAGAPLTDRLLLQEIVERYLRSPGLAVRQQAAAELSGYLRSLIDERIADPRNDLVSRVTQAEMFGRPVTMQEIESCVYQLFIAGLDTVAAVLSFIMRFLANNQDHYRQLADNPALIKDAVEELLRVSGVAMPERGVTTDHVFHNTKFQKYDPIIVLSPLSGINDEEVEAPENVAFDRDVSKHMIFGGGPHRCLGSHLARVEIRVFLEEWLKRFPSIRVGEDDTSETLGGIVWTPAALHLAW